MSSSGAPGETDAARLGGIDAAGVDEALGDVPVELQPVATATTSRTPTSPDGRKEDDEVRGFGRLSKGLDSVWLRAPGARRPRLDLDNLRRRIQSLPVAYENTTSGVMARSNTQGAGHGLVYVKTKAPSAAGPIGADK